MDVVEIIIFIIGVIAVGGVLFQVYDGIRAGLTGTQPRASKEDGDDPKTLSTRVGSISYGLFVLFIFFSGWIMLRVLG